MDGLNGTLIANQYTREEVDHPASSIRTVISLDNGGFWEGVSSHSHPLYSRIFTLRILCQS